MFIPCLTIVAKKFRHKTWLWYAGFYFVPLAPPRSWCFIGTARYHIYRLSWWEQWINMEIGWETKPFKAKAARPTDIDSFQFVYTPVWMPLQESGDWCGQLGWKSVSDDWQKYVVNRKIIKRSNFWRILLSFYLLSSGSFFSFSLSEILFFRLVKCMILCICICRIWFWRCCLRTYQVKVETC